MKQKRSRWGIGPVFTLISLIYSVIIYQVSLSYFPLKFIIVWEEVNFILGGTLIVIGLLIFIIGTYTLQKNFNTKKLQTGGIYAFMRHPIYGSWIVFIVPGIVLIFGYILGLSIPVFMYLVFKILIKKEEKALMAEFGKEYFKYQKKVKGIFPTFSLRK